MLAIQKNFKDSLLQSFPFDEFKATEENRSGYQCLQHLFERLKNGWTDGDERYLLNSIAESAQNYIGTLHSVVDGNTSIDDLKQRLNCMKIIMKRLSMYTYDEFFETYPLLISFNNVHLQGPRETAYDLWHNVADEARSLFGIDLYRLNVNDIIGDKIVSFIKRCCYTTTKNFAHLFRDMAELLLERDSEIRSRYADYEAITG